MQAFVTLTHTCAACTMFHAILKRHEREEQVTALIVIAVIALAGLAQMFLGITAE